MLWHFDPICRRVHAKIVSDLPRCRLNFEIFITQQLVPQRAQFDTLSDSFRDDLAPLLSWQGFSDDSLLLLAAPETPHREG